MAANQSVFSDPYFLGNKANYIASFIMEKMELKLNNEEIQVSFCNTKLGADGKVINPSVGTPLMQKSLYDILTVLPRMKPNEPKGSYGAIFPYIQDKLGLDMYEKDKVASDGIVFVDIDHLPKTDIRKIYDSFSTIAMKMCGVLSCWFSHSYYNNEKNYGGLHFVIRPNRQVIEYKDYNECVTTYGACLVRVIYKVTGIDCRPYKDNGVLRGIDPATKSVGQRFFLNHSEMQWNEWCTPQSISIEDTRKLKEWFKELKGELGADCRYVEWFPKKSDLKIVRVDAKEIDITSLNGTRINLGFRNRITLLNTLAFYGVPHDKRVKFLMDICGPEDYRDGHNALYTNVVSASRTAESRKELEPGFIEYAKEVLAKVGIDWEVEIERVYQPIEIPLDPLFMTAWEEQKDVPRKGTPHCFELAEDEYLSTHKGEIGELILNHKMTYLVADCMVGKTTYALDMKSEYGLFDDFMFMHIGSDTIDLCLPYNSVADNKSSVADRNDINRVRTCSIKDFSDSKRNVFIWDTVKKLYDEYFKLGICKRAVLFFDECQKIVTDEYRWSTIIEMFKMLPDMYTHFVFMTGTPAGELEYLKRHFEDYCIIKVDKREKWTRTANFLLYQKNSIQNKVNLLEGHIAKGNLPLIYTNRERKQWNEAILKMNVSRMTDGQRPLKVLYYDKDNAERLNQVNTTKSIKDYDIVIATAYCSVGVDFYKDDSRPRVAIVDYMGEDTCTFQDIWQFALRNRHQSITMEILTRTEDWERVADEWNCIKKVNPFTKSFQFCLTRAQLHTQNITRKEVSTVDEDYGIDEESVESAGDWLQATFQSRKFKKLMDNGTFNDERNVLLLALYYRYITLYGNINAIKDALEKRNCKVNFIEMTHTKGKTDSTIRKEIYDFFVEHFNEISDIIANKGAYDQKSHQIDLNTNERERIEDGKVYSREKKYMNWLIAQFAGKEEWIEVLKATSFLNKGTFRAFNYLKTISKTITDKELRKLKRWNELEMDDEDIAKMAEEIAYRRFAPELIEDGKRKDFCKTVAISELVTEYSSILKVAINNADIIEEIKTARENGTMTAVLKLQMAFDATRKLNETHKRKKAHEKKIVIKFKGNGKKKEFNSRTEMADFFGVTKVMVSKLISKKQCKLSEKIEVLDC